jgi:CheY-like chemotaxis protein
MEIIQQHSVRFYVKDSGIGILKENQHIIFEKFRKIEDDTGVLFRGIGLGLAIAKQIVEQLGGSISLESEFGKGSDFYFIIPDIIKSDISEAKTKQRENLLFDLEGKTILIAEDEDSNYAYVETLLRKKNPVLIRAKNGLEAINCCISNPPDFILMDIRMPVMDGISAFRRNKSLFPTIKIMALTSYAMISEKEKILNEGFDRYLAKPFTQSSLLKMIAEMMSI